MEKAETNYLIVIKDQDILKDLSSLISLYEPIIGAQALALYLSLINEAHNLKQLNYPKFELSRLYKISSLTEKNFYDAIKKLESLRLVKSKISRKTGIKKYEIFSPLEPSEFFENELFEKTLAIKIGLENIEALKFLFKEKNDNDFEDDFEDVTAVFDEVFAEELKQIFTSKMTDDVDFINLKSSKKTILEKMLDLNLLTKLLKKFGINLSYSSKNNKKFLNWALSIHNFNEKTLAELIKESFDFEKNKLDFEVFELKIKALISSKKESRKVEKTFFETEKELTSYEILETKKMNNKKPEEFVEEITKYSPDLNVRKMIKTLIDDYHFDNGSVNYLIEFSCFKNNNHIIVNYIYKIADSLKEFGIMKVTDVLIYLSQLKRYSNNQKKDYYQTSKFDHNLINLQKGMKPLSYDEIVQLTAEL